MSTKTHIQWCDSTDNFWSGCTMVPAAAGLKDSGCLNCYAKAYDHRHLVEKISHWGKGAPRLKQPNAVAQALAMNRKPWICNQCGQGFADHEGVLPAGKGCFHTGGFHRRRIFSLSRGDWLDDEVPIEWLAEMLDTIRRCDQVTWILCSKRPELWQVRTTQVMNHIIGDGKLIGSEGPLWHWLKAWKHDHAPQNIWHLTSVENQAMADKRIPELLKIPAACHGLSLEPLLGLVDLTAITDLEHSAGWKLDALRNWHRPPELIGKEVPPSKYGQIKWLIIGGESGHAARRCNLSWIRSLVAQGAAAGVPTFVKQLGGNLSDEDLADCSRFSGRSMHDNKGGDPAEWPADLRIRQFPTL